MTYSESNENGKAAGGRARAAKLTPEQRSASAKKAAASRWSGDVVGAVCGSPDSPLVIGDTEIECYVLDDGTRVLTQAAFLQAFGRSRTVRRTNDDGLPPMVQGKALRPYISEGLVERATPILFNKPGGGRAHGYDARLLPDVCDAFLAARAAGALPQNQHKIAEQAELLMRGLARVGIIALVDEATGYQDVRTKDALAKILEQFIDEELQPYLTTFPPEFYKEMFRLRGIEYDVRALSGKRPRYFGHLTNNAVYRRLAPGVLEELKRVQEKTKGGTPKHKLFQRLTGNVGYPKLQNHLSSVIAIMKLSSDWEDFKVNLEKVHPLRDGQPTLFDEED